MTQQDKDLILKYFCMALPYGVVIKITSDDGMLDISYNIKLDADLLSDLLHGEDDFMPYLRSMSSMTEEEKKEFNNIPSIKNYQIVNGDLPWDVANYKQIQWLLKKHFDFIGLIPEGLAIEVTEENNPYNITEE